MTKREPFAQFEDHHEGYELSGMLLGGVCFIELPMGAPGDIEIVDKTNDAHEARVKEAVREAVEEFRERVVEAIFNQPCGMSMYASSREAEAAQEMRDKIQELVEKLPTDPEG